MRVEETRLFDRGRTVLSSPEIITDRSKAVVLMWSLLAVLVSEFRRSFTLCLFIIVLVQFGLLSGHLLGNSCPLG